MIRERWHKRVTVDLLVWVFAALMCILWRWVTDKSEIAHYWALFGILAVLWVLVGLAVQVYRSYKETWFWQALLSLIADAAILIGLCQWLLPQQPYPLSPTVATWTILLVGAMETLVVLLEHYWKYATNMTVPAMSIEQRENARVRRLDEIRSPESMESIHQSVLSVTNEIT